MEATPEPEPSLGESVTVTSEDCEPAGALSVVVGAVSSSVTVAGAESVVLPAASVARATTVYCAPFVRLERSQPCDAKPDVVTGDWIVVPDANEQLVPAQ